MKQLVYCSQLSGVKRGIGEQFLLSHLSSTFGAEQPVMSINAEDSITVGVSFMVITPFRVLDSKYRPESKHSYQDVFRRTRTKHAFTESRTGSFEVTPLLGSLSN